MDENRQLLIDAMAAVKLFDRIEAGDKEAELALLLAHLTIHRPEELKKEFPALLRRARIDRVK